MPEISQDEAEALRAVLRQQARRGATAAPAPQRAAVRRYDFRVPDKFPKDVLRQIIHLHESMNRSLTTSLSAQFRTTVRVEDALAEQRTYQEFVREAPDPAILAAFSAEPLSGSALLDVDPINAVPMIDRLLGGSGESMAMARPVTEIELSVVQRVLAAVLDAWRDAWSHIVALRPRILGVETNPLFMQLVAPSDIVLAVSMVCGLGRQEGRLRLCFPFGMIEPLVQRLAARQWAAAAAEPPGSRSAEIRAELGDVLVPLSVEIGRARLPLRRVLALQPGDLLPLGVPVSSAARLHVRGRPKFLGRVGRRGRTLAVQIMGLAEGVGRGATGAGPRPRSAGEGD
jgi:flagellar motor switch protein FliM